VFATVTTVLIVFAFNRKLAPSSGVGIIEVITKLILYYFHERMWAFSGIGKKKHPLSSLPIERPLKEPDMQVIKTKLKDLGYISED